MALFDLHTHSTHSDGLLAARDVVLRAATRGVQTLALTDHDELAGLPEAAAAAVECGVQLVNGVEVSVTWQGTTVHIVGLQVDPHNEALVGGLQRIRDGRDGRAERIAASLESAGIANALEGARRHAANPELVSRAHFARYLVEQGCAPDTNAVFRRYLIEGKPGYVPHEWARLEDAVGWINGAGGMAVVAHPGRYRLDELQRDALLGAFKEMGGVAVEVVTGSHTPDQYAYWGKAAVRYGFLASTGSDFHGPRESYRDLGDLPPLPAGCVPVWTRF
jgi:3',5'-nucleoside bisphosphate phosphatase